VEPNGTASQDAFQRLCVNDYYSADLQLVLSTYKVIGTHWSFSCNLWNSPFVNKC